MNWPQIKLTGLRSTSMLEGPAADHSQGPLWSLNTDRYRIIKFITRMNHRTRFERAAISQDRFTDGYFELCTWARGLWYVTTVEMWNETRPRRFPIDRTTDPWPGMKMERSVG